MKLNSLNMLSFSSYVAFISIIIITVVIIITVYCIRLKRVHRHILPYPMQVFVITQPHQQRLHCPQMFWSSSVEQPPPSYNAVIQSTDTNWSIARENNGS
jgi:hypothetical protein